MASGNSPFTTGGSVSSLLKSANAAAARVQEYNDALVAYDYDNSTKTYADYLSYSAYLEGRAQEANDPMTVLGYQKKLDSARRGYISNEIQRQSISVIEGGTSNVDKYNRMADLYYQADASGMGDLAQGLRLQLDNLSVTIQNEQKASIAANKEAAAELTKSIDAQVKDAVSMIQNNATAVLTEYSTLGPQRFQQEYGSDIFSILSNMVNSTNPQNPGLVQIYDQARQVSPDPSKVRAYQVSLTELANGGKTGLKLPGIEGDITYKDLQDQAYAQSIGQTLFDTISTGKGVQFTKNETTGYAWGRDENGQYKLMPVLNPKQNFTSGIVDPKSKKGEAFTYNDLLKNGGFEVISGASGNSQNLVVRNNGQFDNAGIPRGQQVELYVDLKGNLQVVNGDKAYTLGFDPKTGSYSGLNALTPDSINLLPGGNARYSKFNSRYFAGQDTSNLPAGTIGTVDTSSPYARAMEAGPLSNPQPVVQQGNAGVPQPLAPIGVQQGAVSPIGLPASTSITLAKPQPLPNVTVAKPQPLPKVAVTQAKPKPGLSVGNAKPNPKIVF